METKKHKTEGCMFNKKLSDALCKIAETFCLLAQEIHESREQRKIELEWFRSHYRLATLKDQEAMERRLTIAIAKEADVAPSIEAAAIRLGAELDKLDATITDKQTETKV